MKLIVGLGNPGEKYQNNRHNVGFMVADYLKNRENQYRILKPQTFMNRSGEEVSKTLSFYKHLLEDLVVIHDDLDIPIGEFKIQKGVGPKSHNGILSVEKSLGTKDFWRVRVGVENREPENKIPGEAYVLQDFTEEEKKIVDELLPEIESKLSHLIES